MQARADRAGDAPDENDILGNASKPLCRVAAARGNRTIGVKGIESSHSPRVSWLYTVSWPEACVWRERDIASDDDMPGRKQYCLGHPFANITDHRCRLRENRHSFAARGPLAPRLRTLRSHGGEFRPPRAL